MGAYIQEFYIRQAVGVSYVISDVLFCLCLTLVLNDRPWDRKGILLKLADFAATFAAMLVINSLAFRLRSSIQFVRLVALPILVAAHLPFGNRYDWTCRAVMGLTYYSSYILILVIAAEAVMALRMFGLLAPKNGGFDMTTVLAIVMPGVMTVFLRRFSIASFRYRHRFTTILILCMVILTQLLQCLHMDTFYTSVPLLVFRIAANTVLWILELLAYYMLYVITKEYNENLSLQAEKLRMETDRVLTDFSEQNFTQLRNLRHDLRNQFAYMNALIEQGEYERLKSYFSALSRDAMVPLGYLDCGNNAINAILHFERTRAAASGVEIAPHIVVPPALSIEEHDLCSLLSNLLDNAIEAAAQSEADNKTVELNIVRREGYLIVRVANPFGGSLPDAERLRLISTKRDGQLHGFGTAIIRRIAGQYNGVSRFRIENGRFVADVMLELEEPV